MKGVSKMKIGKIVRITLGTLLALLGLWVIIISALQGLVVNAFFGIILLTIGSLIVVKKGFMLVSGIASSVIGAILLIFGFFFNSRVRNDFNLLMEHGNNPGNGFILVGVILLFIGIVILGLRYVKKQQTKE